MNGIGPALAIVLALAVCATAFSQPATGYESFEEGVPDYFSATRADTISISPWHSKQGSQSLRWDWTAGEELLIRHGIGDVERVGGHRCTAGFSVWLYVEEPIAGTLVFEFIEGEQVTGSFRFPMDFSGWRQGRVGYQQFPEGQPTSDVDTIRIVAPDDPEAGTVFIDFIKYNTLTLRGNWVDPEKVSQWRPPVPDEERFPKPDEVMEAELAGIRKLLGPEMGTGIAQERVDALRAEVDALEIVRDEHGIRGPGIDAHYQYLSAPGDFGKKDVHYFPDEHGPGWCGMQTPAKMSSLAYRLARAYRDSNDPEQRARLAEAFLLVTDHVHDQALQAGSGFKWNWWVGGAWADAIFLMRDVLADARRLQGHLDFLLYTYGGGVIFREGDPPSHMDFYNLTVPRLLRQCLLQVEPAEQVRWLRAFKAMLERSMLQPKSAFKVDGSAYHHGGHYHSYACGAFAHLPPLFRDLNDTPWDISEPAHERLRRAMLAQRFYANRLDLPIALKGRSPFAPGYGVIRANVIDALGVLATCGSPDGEQQVDREVAAAYLRLMPEAAGNEPYVSLGIQPEPEPNGCFAMPYAGLLCHRRDNWLAAVKGQSKYVWGSERQAQRNCFGLFQGLGSLEILAGGDPVSAEASGRSHPGWDWRRFPGVTVPQVPLREIDLAWRSRGRVYSPETFVGGLTHGGQNGVFAMVINQAMPEDHTLTGKKSWFFFENAIVCLGSNITCDDPRYPTQTTLCQQALPKDADGAFIATVVDGAAVAGLPAQTTAGPETSHWFIDIQQTGYLIPEGHDTTVARRRQNSRDFFDTEETEGDFLSAWLDHGNAPEDAQYEYVVVVRATPEAMQDFVDARPYEVIRCDEDAHIVRHPAEGRWSCVFFTAQDIGAQAGDELLPIRAVDRPCLVMAEELESGTLVISVADPDLNLEDGVNQPLPLRVRVRGKWTLEEATGTLCDFPLADAAEDVSIASTDAEETVLEILCRHGASYDIALSN